MMISSLRKIVSSFSKTKVKVYMCGVCSYGRDFQFLKNEVWKLDPQIQVEAEKTSQRNGKFQIQVQKKNLQPKVIFDAQKHGRISPFNIASVLKQIRDW